MTFWKFGLDDAGDFCRCETHRRKRAKTKEVTTIQSAQKHTSEICVRVQAQCQTIENS